MGAHHTLNPEKLEQLLASYGIGREFIDFSGNVIHTPMASRLQILACMGVKVDSPDALEALLRERISHPGQVLAARNLLGEVDRPVRITVRLAGADLQQDCSWRVTLEDGSCRGSPFRPADLPRTPASANGTIGQSARVLELAALPAGYHHLELRGENWHESAELIVAPAQTWQPPDLADNKRMWGISAQLYTLRSAQDWGIGDFRDLRELCVRAAAMGADFVLLNPLHCPDLRYPDNASPYSPDDRRFLNPWYIHLPACEDYGCASVKKFMASAAFQEALQQVRDTPLVDYDNAVKLKLQVLCLMYEQFCSRALDDTLQRELRDFLNEGGEALADFASFQAGRFTAQGGPVAEKRFHEWLQWLAARQLVDCQQECRMHGMRIGLVQDMAVGSNVEGCEVQTSASKYCLQARIGAPPDYFNPDGQNWGLPPLLPDALEEDGCRHFRLLLQANMRGCGALRIDHVMSLMRLWWCPDEGSNATGAYVYYPVDLLFAVLRLESQRHRCLVIGEDLGVVPPEIRHYLDSSGIFSNSVFYFEKYDGWHFRKPDHYKARALAMMANHDVPPLECWWSEGDLALRRSIGMIPDEQKYLDEIRWRRGEKGQILHWLQEQDLLPSDWQVQDTTKALDGSLKTALAGACGRFASLLVSVQLDDLAGATSPVNIPGTHTEHDNWRRKLPLETETIFDSTIAVQMMKALHNGRQK